MELIQALDFLKLKDISNGWVDVVWDYEFTETEQLDSDIEDRIIRKGAKAFNKLHNCLLTYETACETPAVGGDRSPESIWTVFAENVVSAKSLVAVLSYFVLRGKDKTASLEQRLNALHAASIYVLLLGIPGSVANKVFHQVLFDTAITIVNYCWPQTSGKKRKKDSLKSSQAEGKRSKPHRKENEEMEVDELDEEDEEVEVLFSAQGLLKLREGVVLLVQTLLGLLKRFPLKDKTQSAETCVQFFTKLTDFEPVLGRLAFGEGRDIRDLRTVPEMAYFGLWSLCSPDHGNENESLRRVFHGLLYVILMMNSEKRGTHALLMPTQAVLASRDHAISFVCYLVDELNVAAQPCLRILLQHICYQMVEKADYRTHGAQAMSKFLSKMPSLEYASFIKWLFDYSRQSKVAFRMFAMDVAIALMEQPERAAEDSLDPELAPFLAHKFLVQNLLFGRRSDISPTVRGHALTCLAQCLELPSHNVTRSVQDLFSITGARSDSETYDEANPDWRHSLETRKTLPFKTIEITNSTSANDYVKENVALLKLRLSDPKTNVRKSALQAIMSLLKHRAMELSTANLAILSDRCRDPALSVKKKALQCLMELLSAKPESDVVQVAWLRGFIPAVVDPESSVQEKALEGLEQVLLRQLKKHSSSSFMDACQKLAWDLLGLLCHKCQDLNRYFSKAFMVWSKQDKFTPTFIANLISHTEAEHAPGAWLLLSKVASTSPMLEYGRILDAWDELVRSKNASVGTSCNILCVVGDVAEHLNEDTRSRIVEEIMSWLMAFNMPLELVSASVETLCRLGWDEDMARTQNFLNQHCGRLVSVCENYLSGVILNENGAQNLNEDLVVKQLYTLGVASVHCPAKVGKRTFLLVQSILTPSVDMAEGAEDIGPSQPLSQFKPTSLPGKVRAHAIITLGKLCLQHEELALKYLPAFARELELCQELAVRSNVVVVMCDLCVRYTNTVGRYIPNISACLQDKEPLIREQTLTMLTNLLQEEYVKWKGSLFFRFVTVLVDTNPAIASLCEYCLVHLLLKKNPVMFSQHFIECIFHFNSYYKHRTYNQFPQTESEKARCLLKGAKNRQRRFQIYRFLLEHFTDAQRFNITIKISQTVLACFVDGELPLDPDGAEILAECFGILSLKEIKLLAMSAPAGVSDEQEEEQLAMAKAVIQVAQKKVVSQVQKRVFIENIIPIIISLKSMLEQKRSAVLKDLMCYLQVTMQDYRSEVKEFFAADEQLAAELEYNLKMFEKENQDQNQEIENQMLNCSLAGAKAGSVLGSPAPVAAKVSQKGFLTPQARQQARPGLQSARLVQSARRPSPPPLVIGSNPRSSIELLRTRVSNRQLSPLGRSENLKITRPNRAISTPQGCVNDVTFGEGVSAIFSDRKTDPSKRDDGPVLFLASPEKQAPAPRQWNVQSPLRVRKT